MGRCERWPTLESSEQDIKPTATLGWFLASLTVRSSSDLISSFFFLDWDSTSDEVTSQSHKGVVLHQSHTGEQSHRYVNRHYNQAFPVKRDVYSSHQGHFEVSTSIASVPSQAQSLAPTHSMQAPLSSQGDYSYYDPAYYALSYGSTNAVMLPTSNSMDLHSHTSSAAYGFTAPAHAASQGRTVSEVANAGDPNFPVSSSYDFACYSRSRLSWTASANVKS